MTPSLPPLINGVRHSWAQINVVLFGTIVTGITAISYGSKQEKEDFYGAGENPVHRGRGNKTHSASMKLYKYVVDQIMATMPEGSSLLDIAPFNISVSYIPVGASGIITDVINNVEFLEQKVDTKQGDKMLEIDLPLITSHIIFNKK